MAPQPILSIVVPCLNAERFLPALLTHLSKHTRDNVEIIAVNDGSSDATPAILRQAAESTRAFRALFRPHRGLAAARNAGIAAASGKFVTFLDADDMLCAEALRPRIQALQKAQNPLKAFFCRYWLVDASGRKLWPYSLGRMGVIGFPDFTDCPFPVHTVMISRETLKLHGKFDETLKTAEDFDLWQRLARSGVTFTSVPQGSVAYRQHKRSMIHSDPLRHLETFAEISRRVFETDARVKKPMPEYNRGIPAQYSPAIDKRILDYSLRCCVDKQYGLTEKIVARLNPLFWKHARNYEWLEGCRIGVVRTLCRPASEWNEFWPEIEHSALRWSAMLPLPSDEQQKIFAVLSQPPFAFAKPSESDITHWRKLGRAYKRIAFFGAGRQGARLYAAYRACVEHLKEKNVLPDCVCFLDDCADAESPDPGVPVLNPEKADIRRLDAILISSPVHAEAMKRRCRELYGPRLPLVEF